MREGIDDSVIIKILKKERMKDQSDIGLFLEEANTLIRLQSRIKSKVQGVVFCYNLGMCTKPPNTPYIIFEYLKDYLGLNELLRLHKMIPERDTLIIMRECARVLDIIHQPFNSQRILHRDISPDNIMLKMNGNNFINGNSVYGIKLIDFGVVFTVNENAEDQKSEVRGKPKYMPPELLDGHYDERSELYSLGVVMFELLSGRVPFEGKSYPEILALHKSKPVPCENLPPDINKKTLELLKSLLAKKPHERPGSASELYEQLDALIE
jgi:serine/threonine-protein kinase